MPTELGLLVTGLLVIGSQCSVVTQTFSHRIIGHMDFWSLDNWSYRLLVTNNLDV